jgi:glycosyltransferase involved in cell wall biosynthesis
MATIVVYTYYSSPWEMKTGDDVRIHSILKTLALHHKVVVVNSSTHPTTTYTVKNRVIYIPAYRPFYHLLAKITAWKYHHDLNTLAKATHYIDEAAVLVKNKPLFNRADLVMTIGSMTVASAILRMLGIKKPIIYDPLANYAQTLYLRSRKNILELIKYGLYLALHKLQLISSTIITYPSRIDDAAARQMFKKTKTHIITNPPPLCYQNTEEYSQLRRKRNDFTKPYFILLAGSHLNKEAVLKTIEIFNNIPPSKFTLFITGPWQHLKYNIKNETIKILGVVPHERLKELLAMADYGLSPIFNHAAGTFIKMLAYQAADLHIIASPHSLLGLDIRNPRKIRIVRNYEEYAKAIEEAIQNYKPDQERRPLACEERDKMLEAQVDKLLSSLT